jgi:hypothetical protein
MDVTDWELNLFEGKNPIHTGSFLTSYDAREFTPEAVIARESGQNALDAGQGINTPTKLVFHKLFLDSNKKDEFLELFQFRKMLEPRISEFNKSSRNTGLVKELETFLSNKPVSALLIRDYNTCGLGGDWQAYDVEDHFGRLVCALNLDDKSDADSSRGGSFGLGKTAYAKSSAINTVIYHSVFKETTSSMGANRRLMANGIYPKHQLKDKTYGGFAYFGEKDGDEVKPLTNDVARQFWGQIGDILGQDLSRSDSETGTDVLILMDAVDIELIKRAIEEYYFPALIEGKLHVEFKDETGQVEVPQPMSRNDLDQFIRLYKQTMSGTQRKDETIEVGSFNKFDKHKLGRYAFQTAESDEAESERKNCVAITRGTGMILNYVKMGSDRYEPAVGVYLADEDVVPFLNISENAAHSEWSENSRRLHQQYPFSGPEIVKAVNSRIKSKFSTFQKSLQPDVSNTKSQSGYLARLLAGALSGDKGSTIIPRPENPRPVAIHLIRDKRDEATSLWHLKILPNEHTPPKSFKLTLWPSISLAGDAKRVAIKHMKIRIVDDNNATICEEEKPEITVDFDTQTALDYQIQFPNPGRRNYIVQCKCEALMEAVNE